MQTLRNLVNDKDHVHSTSDFINEDTKQKDAYNDAVTNGEAIISGQQNPVMNKSTIDQAINQISTAKDGLHGANKLQRDKDEANQTIAQLDYLSDAQKTGVQELVNGANTRSEVQNHLHAANDLNNSMHQLRDKIAEKTNVKQSSDYINETTEHQNTYNQELQDAEALVNKTTNPILDKSDVDQKLQDLTEAQTALQGSHLLENAKNEAITTINSFTALNNAQRQQAIQNVQAQTTIPAVNHELEINRELNSAMQSLRDVVRQQNDVHQQSNYFNEDDLPKQNYDSAIQSGQAIIDKDHNPIMSKAEIEQATNQISTSQAALDGENKLHSDQTHANEQIDYLSNLNERQINAEKDLINQSTTRSDVAQKLAKAKELNDAMKALRDGIQNKDELKQSSAYINADPTKKSAYDEALQNAENIISATPQPELNKAIIDDALSRVQRAQNELDGAEQLANAKREATQNVNGLTSLNEGQKRELNNLINAAETRTKVEEELAKATNLNNAMADLRNSIQNVEQIKQGSNYVNEDPTEQHDYDNAVTNAQNAINNNNQPILDKDSIDGLAQSVNTTRDALQGENKLARDQQAAVTEIRNLTSLNNPQKNTEIEKVNAATTRDNVRNILQEANTLNTAMHGLRESIRDQVDTKNNSKYINEDPTQQQAYDNAINDAQQVIDETQATLDPSTINNLTNEVMHAKSDLHGDTKLQQEKDQAKQTIAKLRNLNNAQIGLENTLIDSEQTRTQVKHDLAEAQALDGLMGALKDSIQDNSRIVSEGNYINAEPNKKQAYDNAVQVAQNIINGTNQPTLNKGEISRATNNVISTKEALDGNTRLANAQRDANQTITNLPNLNEAQKDANKLAINNANTLEQVQQNLQIAQELDNAMGSLRQSIANKDQVRSESRYLNEDPAIKANYDNAVAHADSIIQATQNPELNKANIEQATQAVQLAEQALHGAEKLNQDKNTATNTLDGLTNLTDAQREKLKEQINNSDSREDIKQKIEQAKALNNAMEQLKNEVGHKDNVHSSGNYLNEDPDKKKAYDDAIKRAEDIIKNSTDPNLNPHDITNVLNQINQAKDNLHGDDLLQHQKDTSNQSIDNLNHLNQPQKDALKQAINDATSREQVAEKIKEAQALDEAMKQLEDQVSKDPSITSGSPFINEDSDKQKAYNDAVQAAKDLINQTSNPTLDKQKVEEALHNIQNAVNDLHGDDKLNQSKQDANDQLTHLNNLTEEQKNHFKTLIDDAETRGDVNKQVALAKRLDDDMGIIKGLIGEKDKVHQSMDYINADDATKQAYDNAIKEAEDLINNHPDNLDHKIIEDLANKIEQAQQHLNGQERFDQAQKNALRELDAQDSLNTPQRETFKTNINQATTLDGLDQELQKAKELNTAMKLMRESIADQDDIRHSSNYTNEDPAQQHTYEEAVNNVNAIISENTATMDPQTINQTTQAVANAKRGLQGDQKLQDAKNNAKQEIQNSTGLTDVQKQTLNNAIDQLTNRPSVSKKLQDAKYLNSKMEELKATIAKAPAIRQSSNYINEDTPEKETYNNSINKGQSIIDAQTDPTLDGGAISNVITEIDSAEKGLHGADKLQQAQNHAIIEVNGLDALNPAQKAKERDNILAATNKSDITPQLEHAKALNQAMEQLKQSIATKNETLNSSNYINEDSEKKLAYDNAVSEAEQLLNQQNNPTMDKDVINAVTEKVNNARNDLNGADKLVQNQTESNAVINQLPNLNEKQKQALNELINNSTSKQKVAEIIAQANELNNEMGRLKTLVDEQPTVHQQSNYSNEDENIQNTYDNAIHKGQDIINGNDDVLNINKISDAIQNIELAKSNLHGEQKLQQAQQEANNEIDHLSNLNDSQKQGEHNEINTAPSRAEVVNDLNNAKALNEAMRQLENEVRLENNIKQTSNYINEDEDPQNAYNNALQKAKDIINAVPDGTLDKATVEQILTELQQAKDALHGEQKLQEAKEQANVQIDKLDALNPGQVLAEKTLINQAQTRPAVQEALQKAKELNDVMKALRSELAKKDQVKGESKYINADSSKQTTYDNALNLGSQIITTTQPPELDKDVINSATQSITNAENDLNGQVKLTEAVTNGNQEIDNLHGLTQAQKDKENESIKQAPTVAQVTDIINNAKQLDNAMSQLQQALNQADQIKQSGNYINEDSAQKNAYNQAIQTAKDLINSQPPVMDKQQIDQALDNINQTQNNLNGNQKLLDEQNEKTNQLTNLNSLTNGQHDAFVNDIYNATTRDQVTQIFENAKQLNNTMKALRDSISDHQQVLQSSNYKNEDPVQQDAYNQAVAKALEIISDRPTPNLTNETIQRVVDEVTQAKQNLRGEQKLAEDKANAEATLNQLTHLNPAQREDLENQIHNATNRPEVHDAINLANQLNDAMKKLKDALDGNEALKQSSDYINEDTNEKGNYDHNVEKGKEIVDQHTNPTMLPNHIDEIANKINDAKNELHGAQKLENDKHQATENINQMTGLNQAQKDQLKNEIQQAQTRPEVERVINKAQPLNQAMEALRQSITDADDVIQTSNYINETPNIQNNYTDAINQAKQIIDQTSGPTMNPLDIEHATSNVQTAKDNLHGERKLDNDKQTQTYAVNHLDNLNQAQKQALTHEINQATTVTDVDNIYKKAKALDDDMKKLKDLVAQQDSVRQSSNYINEDSAPQQEFNDAISQAQAIIDQTTNPTMSHDDIENAINKIKEKVAALDGEHKLQQAKENANNIIDSLNNLNTPQKDAEKALINNAKTRDKVAEQTQVAQELNNAMGGLRNSIQDQESVRQDSKYVNENYDKQQAYNSAVHDAETVINEQNPTLNKDTITQLTQAVNKAKDALNGVELLNADKQSALQSIPTLSHLNPAQQEAFNTQINNANTRSEVQQIIGQAQMLNNAMKALEDSIQDKDQVKNSSNYINEDSNEQLAYDNAVAHIENILQQTTQPTMSVADIQNAINNIKNAKDQLAGQSKLDKAKDLADKELSKLIDLTSYQNSHVSNQIFTAQSRPEVTQALEKAKALNEAMKALNDVYNQHSKVINSSQFINEDEPAKDAYKQAIKDLESVIDKRTNPEMGPTVINNLTHQLENAQNNLHGDQKLAQAKQDAADTINGLTHLNTAQREAIINQNTNATTREQVKNNLDNAQALDQKMSSLNDVVANKNNVLNSSKYLNEDSKYQQPYNQTIADAEHLVNQSTNPTLDPNQVETITNRVLATEKNLHGVEKLNSDKARANFDIGDMKHLNDAQKQAITHSIDDATLRTDVKQILQQANNLNSIMKDLKDKTKQIEADKTSPNYTEASDDRKEALNQALADAQAMIDKAHGSNATYNQVQQVLDKLTQANQNLNGNQRVAEAKTVANNAIDQLKYLNPSQQQTAKDNVEQATKLAEINTAKANAQVLNKSMGQLQQFINDAQSVENSDNYKQADDSKISAYDDALEQAQAIVQKNATEDEVKQAIHQISQAKNNLNGIARLDEARPKALDYINSLDKINNAQKAALIDKVNQSHDLIEINHLVDDGTNLNDIMHDLAQAIIDNYASTKASINYINADSQLKDNFNQAINNARDVLNKAKGQNLNFETVDSLKDAISEAKDALNGIERLKAAKAKADKFIESLAHINQAQLVHALKDIANSDTLTTLARIVDKANDLDEAMQALKDEITQNAAPVQSSSNYINADEDLKDQFDHALNNARRTLAKATGKNLDESEIEGLKQAIKDAKATLNGEQRLAEAKIKAEKALNTFKDLNHAQREESISQTKTADNLQDLAQIVAKAADLNDVMRDLRDKLKSTVDPVKASINYVNADYDLKRQFNTAVKNAKEALSKTKGENLNERDLQGLSQAIDDTKQALNGEQRLTEAKTKADKFIKQLDSLNDAQTDDLTHNVNASDNIKDITQIVNVASDLNDAMKALQDTVSQLDQPTKDSINYQNADEDLKLQFDHAVQVAHDVLNKKDGTNIDITIINGMTQAIQDAKNALNGEHRLNDAQTEAHKAIDDTLKHQLDEINNANATDESKAQAKRVAEDVAKEAHARIDNTKSNSAVQTAKDEGTIAIQNTHADELSKAKLDANNEIDQKVKDILNNIDQNPNLTAKEKDKLRADLAHAVNDIKKRIDQATDKQTIADEKAKAEQLLKDIQAIIKAKEQAKQAIKDSAQRQRDAINNNPDLTDTQKAHAIAEIDKAEQDALKQIEKANTIDDINQTKDDGLNNIAQITIWDTDQPSSILHQSELSLQNALVAGSIVVHRNETITMNDIKHALTLTEDLKVKIISLPNTDKVANGLTAKIEITLANSSKVVVDIPVDVIESELQVAKNEASQQINQVTHQKLDEIDKDQTLTKKQKEQAKAEVQKLKEKALNNINQSTTVTDVEKNQEKDKEQIKHFDPKQFTLDKAKKDNKAIVQKSTKEGVKEIKHITDLTPDEQAKFVKQLQELQTKVNDKIKNAKDLDELKQIIKDFKTQRDQIIAQAQLLGEKHKAERKLDNVVNSKTQKILDNTSATQYQKQLAISRIKQIQLDTMNAIHGAKTIAEVQEALLYGIRRILAVGLDGSFNSLSNQTNALSHRNLFDVRLKEQDVQSHIGQTESYKEVLSGAGVEQGKKKHKEDGPKHVSNHDDSFIDRIIDDFGKAVGFITLTGLLSGFWLVLAKRRKNEEEEEEELKDYKDYQISDSEKTTPLVVAKRKKDKKEETYIDEDDKKDIPVAKCKKEEDTQIDEDDKKGIPVAKRKKDNKQENKEVKQQTKKKVQTSQPKSKSSSRTSSKGKTTKKATNQATKKVTKNKKRSKK
ncbi:DUF1542 domain-containing protein [Staphylococcus caprae]|uniref:DUF1542 domain-containing protein n=1 Tax=Staphylococcus caprae TaxID=29380 RepID=UPI003BAFFC1C